MMFFADLSTTGVIKKIVAVVAVLALIAAAIVVLMPALSSAQVGTPETICEAAGGTWNGTACENLNAEEIACFVFTELNLPLPDRCEDTEEPTPQEQCELDGKFWTGESCEPIAECNAETEDYNSETNECTPKNTEGNEGEGGNEGENNGGSGSENTPTTGGGLTGGGSVGGGSLGGQVLGASTDEVCADPLITTYMGMGKSNNVEEVSKLQVFLNKELGLTLAVSGIFGAETKTAVEQFQVKYAAEVLAPWVPFGLMSDKTPTGYVYKTTKRMINKIHCAALDIPMPQLP